MKRPAFQFYPADWRGNANLRRCSEAARGAWMDILCVLHDSDEYGVVRWPLAELARAAGVALKLAKELATKLVLKGADSGAVKFEYTPRHAGKDGEPVTLVEGDGPIWFSSRMVKDEWVRKRRGGDTQFTTENQPPKQAPKPTIGERVGDGPSSSTSSSEEVAAAIAQTTSDELNRLNRVLGFDPSNFTAHAANIRTLVELKADGCDFEKHILPAAEQAAKGGKGKSLAYIRPRAIELRDAAKLVASMPAPFENTDEAGWRSRLRTSRDKGLWSSKWGPKPGEDGCKCPPWILKEQQQETAHAAE